MTEEQALTQLINLFLSGDTFTTAAIVGASWVMIRVFKPIVIEYFSVQQKQSEKMHELLERAIRSVDDLKHEITRLESKIEHRYYEKKVNE